MTIDELLQTIYYLRIKCGATRQPTFRNDMRSLVDALRDVIGCSHPFSLSHRDVKNLEDQVAAFKNAGNGRGATIPNGQFLYRLASPGDIMFNVAWKDVYSNLIDDEIKTWERLYADSLSGSNWLSLSDYAGGAYHSYCNISWWTLYDLDGEPEDLLFKALKLGVFQNWVQPRCFLLRCHTKVCTASDLANVPSVVDAFRSSVFFPTEEVHVPPTGVTIDLTRLPGGPLTLGVSEFALQPIKTECIEFLPVMIEPDLRLRYSDFDDENVEALKRLVDFYTNLLPAIPPPAAPSTVGLRA